MRAWAVKYARVTAWLASLPDNAMRVADLSHADGYRFISGKHAIGLDSALVLRIGGQMERASRNRQGLALPLAALIHQGRQARRRHKAA